MAREGGIRNFAPNCGIEDRGDGGGAVGLASKPEALEAQLKKYAAAPVNSEAPGPGANWCGRRGCRVPRPVGGRAAVVHLVGPETGGIQQCSRGQIGDVAAADPGDRTGAKAVAYEAKWSRPEVRRGSDPVPSRT